MHKAKLSPAEPLRFVSAIGITFLSKRPPKIEEASKPKSD